jgi:hypothetical protein
MARSLRVEFDGESGDRSCNHDIVVMQDPTPRRQRYVGRPTLPQGIGWPVQPGQAGYADCPGSGAAGAQPARGGGRWGPALLHGEPVSKPTKGKKQDLTLNPTSGVIVVCRRSPALPALFRPCPRSRFPLGWRVTIRVTSVWDSLISLSANPTEVPGWFCNSRCRSHEQN